MQKSRGRIFVGLTPAIFITVILVFANTGIYLYITYTHMQPVDAVRQLKAMIFGGLAMANILLGVWMIKNRLYSRAPFVVAVLLQVASIGLFVASKTIQLPVVPIDTDLEWDDITSKVIQGAIVVTSLIVLKGWNGKKCRPVQETRSDSPDQGSG